MLGNSVRKHMSKYAIELFDNRLLPVQKHAIRKESTTSSSATVKHLIESNHYLRRHNSVCLTVIRPLERTFGWYVNGAFLV